MLFNSFEFLTFFTIVYLVYRLLKHKWQNRLLLLASYVFYGSWDWRFLALIFLSTAVDFYCGKKIHGCANPHRRKSYLFLSLFVNLGALGFFKYFNFFSENLRELVAMLGLTLDQPTLTIILPVGISFYTFQTLGYTIDVYLKRSRAERNFFDFALYVSFFPQLVAGPIERAERLIPQIKSPRIITPEKNGEGIWFIFWGYFLKVFVADNMAKIANMVFTATAPIPGGEALAGVYAFAFQIFGDFAGYSFIAIGVAKLLGFDLMINFLYPYFVTNPRSFWKNWHISLSSWLRDYLYIPLGGNRGGRLLTFRNLFITMALGGLWHGAAWTFVLWGIYHGVVLVVFRLLEPIRSTVKIKAPLKPILHAVQVILMFQITCFGWLLFRASSVEQCLNLAYSIFFNMAAESQRSAYYLLAILFYSFFLLVVQLIQRQKGSLTAPSHLPGILPWVLYIAMFYFMSFWGEFGGQQFIYFQF